MATTNTYDFYGVITKINDRPNWFELYTQFVVFFLFLGKCNMNVEFGIKISICRTLSYLHRKTRRGALYSGVDNHNILKGIHEYFLLIYNVFPDMFETYTG